MKNKLTTPSAKKSVIQDDEKKMEKKLLDRFKVRVSDQEFTIEIYNHDISDELLKKYSILVNGISYTVEVESMITDEKDDEMVRSTRKPLPASRITGTSSSLKVASPVQSVEIIEPPSTTDLPSSAIEGKVLTAPMPGKILEIKTKIGDHVESGQPLVILEAMKMENVMTAPASGVVKEIPIQVGVNVNQGEKLVIIE